MIVLRPLGALQILPPNTESNAKMVLRDGAYPGRLM